MTTVPSAARRAFRREFGMAQGAYRRRHAELENIR
jgi:AraC-like DNA-binding protein